MIVAEVVIRERPPIVRVVANLPLPVTVIDDVGAPGDPIQRERADATRGELECRWCHVDGPRPDQFAEPIPQPPNALRRPDADAGDRLPGTLSVSLRICPNPLLEPPLPFRTTTVRAATRMKATTGMAMATVPLGSVALTGSFPQYR
jgi:hypothetical protein